MKEGQIVTPSSATTIATFLDRNNKFTGGNEYIIQAAITCPIVIDGHRNFEND